MHFTESCSCVKTVKSIVIRETSCILINFWMELSRYVKIGG